MPESSAVSRKIEFECRMAAPRLALLAADRVFVPAASFFESPVCSRIIGELKELYHLDVIYLVGGGFNAAEFIEEKLPQYKRGSPQSQRYRLARKEDLRFLSAGFARLSASKDIANGWLNVLQTDGIGRLTQGSNLTLPQTFEKSWATLPERLGKCAFVYDHVEPLLLRGGSPGTVRNRIKAIINEQYFGSFTREVYAGVVTNLVLLASPHSIPSYDKDLPYREVLREVRNKNLIDRIQRAKLMNCSRS